jgi:ribonuclease Z
VRQLRLETSWGELRITGGSRAGEGSLVLLPQLRLALDAGRPSRALVPLRHVFVSHGHIDHCLGVVAWASQRHLQRMPRGVVLAPAAVAGKLRALLATAALMEGGDPYDVVVREVRAEERIALRPDFSLRFFPTSHWVETIGCCLEWTRRRLRDELAGLAEDELKRRHEAGEEITTEVMTPLLAYLADTGPDVFERETWLADVEVLITECTFVDPRDHERARRFGHTHLDDLVSLAPRLRNRHVVLTHLSRRHRLGPGARAIESALTNLLVARLHLLNVEWE